MQVAVVFALPEQQWLRLLEVLPGTTVKDAVERSGLLEQATDTGQSLGFAIYGRIVPDDHELKPNDRIEILRPLKRDPKETRRVLAQQGRSMGKPARAADRT